MDVARGVFGVALIFGAIVILLTLLNWRDRRASRLRHIVLDQLALPELRGRVGVHIQCAVFSRRRAVIVDLLAGTPHEVWNVFTRMASRLPPPVRIVIHSTRMPGWRGHSVSRSPLEACPPTRPARRSSTRDVAPVSRGCSPAQGEQLAACMASWDPRAGTPRRGDGWTPGVHGRPVGGLRGSESRDAPLFEAIKTWEGR